MIGQTCLRTKSEADGHDHAKQLDQKCDGSQRTVLAIKHREPTIHCRKNEPGLRSFTVDELEPARKPANTGVISKSLLICKDKSPKETIEMLSNPGACDFPKSIAGLAILTPCQILDPGSQVSMTGVESSREGCQFPSIPAVEGMTCQASSTEACGSTGLVEVRDHRKGIFVQSPPDTLFEPLNQIPVLHEA